MRNKEDECNVCSYPKIEFWAIIPDEHGEMFLYPLKDARCCPVCGKLLCRRGENEKQAI
jgi:hypothetical protein